MSAVVAVVVIELFRSVVHIVDLVCAVLSRIVGQVDMSLLLLWLVKVVDLCMKLWWLCWYVVVVVEMIVFVGVYRCRRCKSRNGACCLYCLYVVARRVCFHLNCWCWL